MHKTLSEQTSAHTPSDSSRPLLLTSLSLHLARIHDAESLRIALIKAERLLDKLPDQQVRPGVPGGTMPTVPKGLRCAVCYTRLH